MAPRKFVSEKTLELNLCAEMLSHLRGPLGFVDAFWIGFTQQQEDRRGLDEVLMGLPPSTHLALQFKAPNPTVTEGDPYRFKIAIPQCQRMLDLSARRPGSVYYVLPAYKRFPTIRSNLPNLLARTRFIDVEQLRPHGADAWADTASHHLALDAPLNARLETEPIELDANQWSEIAPRVSEALQVEDLRAWLSDADARDRASLGDVVRTGAFVAVPTN